MIENGGGIQEGRHRRQKKHNKIAVIAHHHNIEVEMNGEYTR